MELGELTSLKAYSIDTGSVFKMTLYPEDGVKPKNEGDSSRDKRFVIIGKTGDSAIVGSLLINSHINDKLFMVVGPYQHCIYPDQYEFLEGKERFIDCYSIKEVRFDRILENGEYIGQISPEDIQEAIQKAKESPAISNRTMKKFNLL